MYESGEYTLAQAQRNHSATDAELRKARKCHKILFKTMQQQFQTYQMDKVFLSLFEREKISEVLRVVLIKCTCKMHLWGIILWAALQWHDAMAQGRLSFQMEKVFSGWKTAWIFLDVRKIVWFQLKSHTFSTWTLKFFRGGLFYPKKAAAIFMVCIFWSVQWLDGLHHLSKIHRREGESEKNKVK